MQPSTFPNIFQIRKNGIAVALSLSALLVPVAGRAQNNPDPAPAGTPVAPPPTTTPADATPTGDPASTAFGKGMLAYQKSDYDTALSQLTQAVSEHPENGDAQAVLGFLQAQKGDYDNAIVHLEKATTLHTILIKRPDSLTNLGKALLARPTHASDDSMRAVTLFEEAAKLSPNSTDAQLTLGYGYAHEKRFDAAVTAYKKATELSPTNYAAWKGLGISLHHQDHDDDAAAALTQATKLKTDDAETLATLGDIDLKRHDSDGALTALEAARKLNAKDPAIALELGILYSHQGRYADAAEAYGASGDLIDAAGGASAVPGIDLAKLRYDQGVALTAAGKPDEAEAAYDKAISLKPGYSEALLNSGTILYHQGKTDAAVARYKVAVAVDPTSQLGWANLGSAAMQSKDWSGATEAWRHVAALEPDNYDVRDRLVTVLQQHNLGSDEAVKYFKQMAAIKPHSADPMIGLGLFYERQVELVPLASQKQAKLLLAKEALETAVKRDPKSAAAYNDLGVVRERRGEMSEAIDDYKKAVALDPKLVDARKNLDRFHISAAVTSTPPVAASGKKP